MNEDLAILIDTLVRLQAEGFPDILEWPDEDVAEDLLTYENHFEDWTPGTIIPLIAKARIKLNG